MKFSEVLWEKIAPITQEIIAHPFNTELANGTLPLEKFQFYMSQDASYLIDFSRCLSLIAAKAPTVTWMHEFLNFSLGALIAERSLHKHFLPQEDRFHPSSATLSYTRYLLSTASLSSFEEGVAAVLPCFWIYREVGQSIAKRAHETNPYALWIDTYSSPEFSTATDSAIDIFDKVAENCSESTLNLMEKAFELSVYYEWHFWNDAYHRNCFKSLLPLTV